LKARAKAFHHRALSSQRTAKISDAKNILSKHCAATHKTYFVSLILNNYIPYLSSARSMVQALLLLPFLNLYVLCGLCGEIAFAFAVAVAIAFSIY
tara:strand:+ start:408 stop:695 length:288 start_codon:yes stop_codon:yes gene_type:complete